MSTILIDDRLSWRPERNRLGMIGYIQSDGYSCGYAAAATLLRYAGVDFARRQLWDELEPDENYGVQVGKLLAAVRRRGLRMSKRKLTGTSINAAISQGNPALCCARLDGQPIGEEHWMVASDYHSPTREILLMNQPVWNQPRAWWDIRKLIRRASEPACWIAS